MSNSSGSSEDVQFAAVNNSWMAISSFMIWYVNFGIFAGYEVKRPKVIEYVVCVLTPIYENLVVLKAETRLSPRLRIFLLTFFRTKDSLPSERVQIKRIDISTKVILRISQPNNHLIAI